MEIICWGSRGSIPVSGKRFNKYGGDTTCLSITAKSGETIIIDGGTGIRRLGSRLIENNINDYHLLFTHAHWDHIIGLAFFRPLQMSKVRITIQDRIFSGIKTREVLDEMLKPPFFPIRVSDLKASLVFDSSLNGRFRIGSVEVETIPTSHPDGGMGYRFTEDGASFVFLTDNELGFTHPGGRTAEDYLAFSRDADLLIHDAEYTAEEYSGKSQWGHSSQDDVLDLAVRAGVSRLGLFHMNQNRTDDEIDTMVDACRDRLAKSGSRIDCFAVACGMTFNL